MNPLSWGSSDERGLPESLNVDIDIGHDSFLLLLPSGFLRILLHVDPLGCESRVGAHPPKNRCTFWAGPFGSFAELAGCRCHQAVVQCLLDAGAD